MYVSVLGLFIGIFIFFNFLEKKIVSLLSLEILMLFSIFSFYLNYGVSSFLVSNFFSLIFLIFMVLDSVLGIVLLICCSRSSSQISLFLF